MLKTRTAPQIKKGYNNRSVDDGSLSTIINDFNAAGTCKNSIDGVGEGTTQASIMPTNTIYDKQFSLNERPNNISAWDGVGHDSQLQRDSLLDGDSDGALGSPAGFK